MPTLGEFLGDSQAPIDTDINPEDVIKWEALDARAFSDGTVRVGLRLATEQEFTLYTDKIQFSGPPDVFLEGKSAPATREIMDPVMGKKVQVYFGGEFELIFRGREPYDRKTFPISIRYIGCTTKICLFPHTVQRDVPVYQVAEEKAQPAELPALTGSSEPPKPLLKAQADEPVPAPAAADLESELAKSLTSDGTSLATILFICLVGGLLTNLTPCVYPMIPITLRVLSGQGHAPMVNAFTYAFGILVSYTVLGLVAALGGGMFGSLLANPTFNLGFAAVMFLFGLSMLGFGNFGNLQRIGARLGTGKPSLRNTFLMGTGAGLVAAPCTGPILAALLAYTVRTGDLGQSVTMLFIYSVGFALPYVFLGNAAARVSKVKVPALIQNFIKIVFAGVMFALSLYYLRIPAYQVLPLLAPYWPMATWVGIGIGIAIALFHLNRDPGLQQKWLALVPCFFIGAGTFAASQWQSAPNVGHGAARIHWYKSESEAQAASRKSGKPILLDAWAEWCEACKKMDASTFIDSTIVDHVTERWIPLKLDLTANSDEDMKIQEKYGLMSLPTLVLLPPGGNVEGKKNVSGYVSAENLMQHLQEFHPE